MVDNERNKFKDNYDFFIKKKPKYLILKNEFSIDTIEGRYCHFEKIYGCFMSGYGINSNKYNFSVTLYRVEWEQKE